MIYNEIQDKDYTFTNLSTWILFAYEDQVDIEKLKKFVMKKY